MKAKNRYFGYLHIGDTIKTTSKGEAIEWTVSNIAIDPTSHTGDVLVSLTNKDKESCTIGSSNLAEWFEKATWTRKQKK